MLKVFTMCSRRYPWDEVYKRVKNRPMRAFRIVKTHLAESFHRLNL